MIMGDPPISHTCFLKTHRRCVGVGCFNYFVSIQKLNGSETTGVEIKRRNEIDKFIGAETH